MLINNIVFVRTIFNVNFNLLILKKCIIILIKRTKNYY